MMGWLSIALRELIDLFIDDDSLALAILTWLLIAAVCIHVLGVDPIAEGLLLAAGFALLLAENVARTAQPQAPAARSWSFGSAAAAGRAASSVIRNLLVAWRRPR